jgi:dTDP-4-dehydrorhamnose 3,5-epimerase
MRYPPIDVAGVTIVDLEPHRDYRGWFYGDDFAKRGLRSTAAQTNISLGDTRVTSRGLNRDATADVAVGVGSECWSGA